MHRASPPPPNLHASPEPGANLDFWPELIKRRVLMHPSDTSAEHDQPIRARYLCRRCGLQTEWLTCRTAAQAAHPRPCPQCNAPETNP